MRPFDLLRYFTLASLAVIAVLAVAIGWIFSRNLERSLTQEAGLYAQDIGHSLNRAIFFEYLLPRQSRGESVDLEDPAQRAVLDAIVDSRTRGLRIMTVILFDTNGTVVYSTKPDYLGYRSVGNPGLEAALAGESKSFLKRAELELDPIRPGHDLLESYTPFFELDPDSDQRGEIIGVLEMYQDARPITLEITRGQREILLATAGLMVLLFLALFEIVRRGHVRIAELTLALEGSNRALEGRVRVRTREIENARRRLRSLFDGITDGISVIDSRFRVLESNSGIEGLFGSSNEPAAPCYKRYAGREEPCVSCPARAALASGSPAEERYRWPVEGGGEVDVAVTAFPFTTDDNQPAVIEVVHDVSDRAELERQLIRSASLANLGEMAAGVAHEIRNPIGMIQSSAQLLERAPGLSDRDRKLLEVIQAETSRVNGTISEFVGFASPPEPSRTATEPAALVERACSMLGPEAERRGARLRARVAPDLPKILVDSELIYRALANLVLNAIQVQEDGDVRIEADRSEADEVVFRVIDEGPGIPEADLERVFQPFYTTRPDGTGLGLSIVQRIVEANGGRVTVSSGPQGSEFAIHFGEALA